MNTIQFWFLLKLLIVLMGALPFFVIAVVNRWREKRNGPENRRETLGGPRYRMTPSTPVAPFATGAGTIEPRHWQEAAVDANKRAA
jgi:hypothetical protein